jgi:UDP-N-acetylmuramate-alanine ligase
VQAMEIYVNRLGLTAELASLRVIHITGTKGKGSTCAYTESILRTQGYRTGILPPRGVHWCSPAYDGAPAAWQRCSLLRI